MGDDTQIQARKSGRWDVCKEAVAFLRQKLTEALDELGLIELVNGNNESVLHLPFCEEEKVLLEMINERKRLVISERCPDGKDVDLISMLEAGSLAFLTSVLERNQINLGQALEWMNKMFQDLTGRYKKELQRFLKINATVTIEESVMYNFHNEITQKLLEQYDQLEKPGNESFQQKYRKFLEDSCKETFSTALDNQKKTVDELQQALEKFIEEQNADYRTLLLGRAKEDDFEGKHMEIHQHSKETSLRKLQDRFFSAGAMELKFAKIELFDKLSSTYNRVLEENAKTKKAMKTAYKKCIKLYKTEMTKTIMKKKISLEVTDLQSNHELILTQCLTRFTEDHESGVDWQQFEDVKQRLEQEIQNEFLAIAEKWGVKRTTEILQVDNFLLKSRMELEEILRKCVREANTLEDLEATWTEAKKFAEKDFDAKFKHLTQDYQNHILIQLTTLLQMFWRELKVFYAEKVALKESKNEAEVTRAKCEVNTFRLLISTLLEEYRKAMKSIISKNPFTDLAKLLEMHKYEEAKIIENFNNAAKPSEDKEIIAKHCEQLVMKLEDSFSVFETEQKSINNIITFTEAKFTAKLLAQAHFAKMKENLIEGNVTDEKLEELGKQEETRIINVLSATPGITGNPSINEEIKKYLNENLSQVYSALQKESQELKLKISQANRQVQDLYRKEYTGTTLQNFTNEWIPPELSIDFHEKACTVAIQKAALQNLIPATTRLLLEANLFLNVMYKKRIAENAVIGIDFGTRYIRAAVFLDGKIQRIPHFDESGNVHNALACYVGVEDFEGQVGQSAEKIVQSSSDWCPVFYGFNAIMGLPSSSDGKVNAEDVSFEVTYINKKLILSGKHNKYPIETILSKLFSKVRANAERFLGASVSKCVIKFTDKCYSGFWFPNQALKPLCHDAATSAGFKQISHFFNRQVIAGSAFSQIIPLNPKQSLLVVNFGMEQLTYFVVGASITPSYKSYVGCLELLRNMREYCIKEFINNESISPDILQSDTANAKHLRRRVLDSCEKALPSFSNPKISEIRIAVPNFFSGKDLIVTITRQKFEELNVGKFKKIGDAMNAFLKCHQLTKENIVKVLLIGGFSQLPQIQNIVTNYFGNKFVNIPGVAPDEVLAYLMAVEGAVLAAKDIRKIFSVKVVSKKYLIPTYIFKCLG